MPRSKSDKVEAVTGPRTGQKRGRAGSGRVTPAGGGRKSSSSGGGSGAAGRTSSGRYTPPIPKDRRHSPAWFGVLLLCLLVLGLLLIVLNYVGVLPGGTHNYYLISGIVAIVAGLVMATFYH